MDFAILFLFSSCWVSAASLATPSGNSWNTRLVDQCSHVKLTQASQSQSNLPKSDREDLSI